jgi:hypothetical protein
MKLDLVKSDYSSTESTMSIYIWFSGCCRSNVFKGFVAGENAVWATKGEAMRLGSAFQSKFSKRLEENLVLNKLFSWSWFEFVWRRIQLLRSEEDFRVAYEGIVKLPIEAKFGFIPPMSTIKKIIK